MEKVAAAVGSDQTRTRGALDEAFDWQRKVHVLIYQ